MTNVKILQQLTDDNIIDRVVNNETPLFEVLIRRYNPYLYKIGRSYGYNHEDVEDLMQETFINAYQHLKGFNKQSSFKTWLVRIMLNNCYSKKQKASARNEFTTQNFFDEKTIPMFSEMSSNETEKVVGNRELSMVIEKAIKEIPFDYRLVFTLREINGFSVAETANTLNITETNVKVRLNRAKAMLRKEVAKMYLPGEIFQFNLIYCDKIVNNVMARILRMKI
jgi:RNA polymerase sigma factor (sigma-70 family)